MSTSNPETRFDLRALLAAARSALRRSHSPYSRFAVSAALLDRRGSIWVGTNIENASYPLGFCAERVALLRWKASGGAPIQAAVVASDDSSPVPPCGLCRDAFLAHAPGALVYLAGRDATVGPFLAAAWLPAANSRSRR